MPMAHACNPSYLGGREQEDCSLKPALANSSQDPISKNPSQKWAGGVAQGVGPKHHKKKKKKKSRNWWPGKLLTVHGTEKLGSMILCEFLFEILFIFYFNVLFSRFKKPLFPFFLSNPWLYSNLAHYIFENKN
jgi:hypothetical protein